MTQIFAQAIEIFQADGHKIQSFNYPSIYTKKYHKNDIRSLSRETENIIDPEEGTRILIEK